jgi:hypothetical protein
MIIHQMEIKISFDRLLYCEYSSQISVLVVSAINLQYKFPDQTSGCYIVGSLAWIVRRNLNIVSHD